MYNLFIIIKNYSYVYRPAANMAYNLGLSGMGDKVFLLLNRSKDFNYENKISDCD
ncbi:MAG TPA: hypothetical protein VNA26_03690 [Chitinophagaceae bacterium]|nr:hypothetical protein [Chitinophagaceae bacterium]